MKPTIFDYHPTYVKLPNDQKKCFSSHQKWKYQLENQKKDPTYDNYSFFYDVFFDLSKKNIWTVGPPLFSYKKNIFPMKIFYKKKSLFYKYHHYQKPTKTSGAACFQIPATGIKEKNPILTFVGKNWKMNIKISQFPNSSSSSQLTLTVLQKNYSLEHILDWILWHYRLYGFCRILFYDNGSKNIQDIKKAFQTLNAPNLEIIIIHWNYYYGGTSQRFDDLFAQNTQLNHTLKLHYKQNCFIANWDMDEYLVSTAPNILQDLIKQKTYFQLDRYDIVDVTNQQPTSIKDCLVRKKSPCPNGKYYFCSKVIRYISNPHEIYNHQFFLLYYILKALSFWKKWRKKITNQNIYLLHAQPIKIIWKFSDTNKRPYKEIFDTTIHIQDQNIQKHLKKAKL